MSPADIPEERAAELLRLMTAADGGQPFMTHKAGAAMASFIVSELEKMAARAENAEPRVKQEWGTRKHVATIYGMTPARADDLLTPWAATGKVRFIAPVDPLTGAKGHRRYNLADVAAAMAGNGIERKEASA